MKQRVDAGNEWGSAVGYSRAVRAGNLIVVSGTTAYGPEGALHPGDAEAQARVALTRIEAALAELGASFADVVETRVFLKRISDFTAVARAHGAAFSKHRPATTMLEANLISDDLLVEIAATAVVE